MNFKYIFSCMFVVTVNIFGAAGSSSSAGGSGASSSSSSPSLSIGGAETYYLIPQPPALDEEKVQIAMDCLPERVQLLTRKIAHDRTRHGMFLFVGPPGTGKTTTARAIGQRHYKDRSYFFQGSLLAGNRYVNSGQETIEANLGPIVAAAASLPQYVVIDEFQKLLKKKKDATGHRGDMAVHFWTTVDKMMDTRNIILVGTCNKVDGLHGPIESRFPLNKRLRFDTVPQDLYKKLLAYYLGLSRVGHVVNPERDVNYIAGLMDGDARQVQSIIDDAEDIAILRNEEDPIIQRDDILRALREEQSRRGESRESWEKRIKGHERKLQVLGTVVGVASLAGVGISAYQAYKTHQQSEQQKECRKEDLERQKEQREADEKERKRMHEEQMKQQHEAEVDRRADVAADYSVLTPPAFRTKYNRETDEVRARADEKKAREWDAIGESVHLSGHTARRAAQIAPPAATATVAAAGVGYGLHTGAIVLPACCEIL